MARTLKPCPFCGGKAKGYWNNRDQHGVYCTKCYARVLGAMTHAQATTLWNVRHTQEEQYE